MLHNYKKLLNTISQIAYWIMMYKAASRPLKVEMSLATNNGLKVIVSTSSVGSHMSQGCKI